jgi:hypothetical protein
MSLFGTIFTRQVFGTPTKQKSARKTKIVAIFPCGTESDFIKSGSGKYALYRVTTPNGKVVENSYLRDMKHFIEDDFPGVQFVNRKI